MGDHTTKQRKLEPQSKLQQPKDQENIAEAGKSVAPPPFQLKSEPIQRQKETEPASEADIAKKKAELDADTSVIKPGQKWDRNDPTIWKQAAINANFKEDAKYSSDYVLCGKKVEQQVNTLCEPKINAVNAAFDQIDDPDVKKAITTSLQKIGARVQRTMTHARSMDNELAPYGLKGYQRAIISDHYIGCALDINENMGTMQNTHFATTKEDVARNKKNGLKGKDALTDPVLRLVEKIIVKYDASFDLTKTKGVAHLEALKAFPGYLQTFVNSVLPLAEAAPIFDDEATVKPLLKQSTKEPELCKQILQHWDVLKGWDHGTRTVGDNSKTLSNPADYNPGDAKSLDLMGIVDLNTTFLKLMLDAGWNWGGDWKRTNKDYMHFQDDAAVKKMTKK